MGGDFVDQIFDVGHGESSSNLEGSGQDELLAVAT